MERQNPQGLYLNLALKHFENFLWRSSFNLLLSKQHDHQQGTHPFKKQTDVTCPNRTCWHLDISYLRNSSILETGNTHPVTTSHIVQGTNGRMDAGAKDWIEDGRQDATIGTMDQIHLPLKKPIPSQHTSPLSTAFCCFGWGNNGITSILIYFSWMRILVGGKMWKQHACQQHRGSKLEAGNSGNMESKISMNI